MKTRPVFTLLLTTILAAGLITSCEDEGSKQRWYIPDNKAQSAEVTTDTATLWGHWVCKDFIDLAGAKHSVRWVRNRPMFVEMVFNPAIPDSVLLITGYENFYAPYEKNAMGELLVKNITPGKNIVLYKAAGDEMQLTDSLINRAHSWVFKKAPEEYVSAYGKWKACMPHYINRAIIEGDYLPRGGGDGIPVTFNANGTINGWAEYNRYNLCLGGECFTLTNTPFDVIELKGEAQSRYMGMVVSPAADSLFLYKLEENDANDGYAYKPAGLAHAFKRLPR